MSVACESDEDCNLMHVTSMQAVLHMSMLHQPLQLQTESSLVVYALKGHMYMAKYERQKCTLGFVDEQGDMPCT